MATETTKKEVVKKPVAAHAATHTAVAATHAAPAHAAASHTAPAAHATATPKAARYTEATGRRKTAVARVRLTAGKGTVIVNGKELVKYFSIARQAASATAPLRELKLDKDYDVSVHVSGGGINAQAEAIRHGIARAIVIIDASWKPRLRAVGYMTRDSRMVERKKYGLKKARRAPQWAKR
jgi:small subunit ribosomal protein S9